MVARCGLIGQLRVKPSRLAMTERLSISGQPSPVHLRSAFTCCAQSLGDAPSSMPSDHKVASTVVVVKALYGVPSTRSILSMARPRSQCPDKDGVNTRCGKSHGLPRAFPPTRSKSRNRFRSTPRANHGVTALHLEIAFSSLPSRVSWAPVRCSVGARLYNPITTPRHALHIVLRLFKSMRSLITSSPERFAVFTMAHYSASFTNPGEGSCTVYASTL